MILAEGRVLYFPDIIYLSLHIHMYIRQVRQIDEYFFLLFLGFFNFIFLGTSVRMCVKWNLKVPLQKKFLRGKTLKFHVLKKN